MAASVERRTSLQDGESGESSATSVKCPICDVTEMQADRGNVCVECERFVCHNCGSFEMSQSTKVRHMSNMPQKCLLRSLSLSDQKRNYRAGLCQAFFLQDTNYAI